MKKYTKFLIILALILVGAGGIFYFSSEKASAPTAVPEGGNISLSVQGIYEHRAVPVSGDETALSILEKLNAEDPSLKLTTKTYERLGVLVTGMGAYENGTGGKYWQYKVNGVMPQIGADKLILKNGDAVEWFFAASAE
jgi:hypothetical protein